MRTVLVLVAVAGLVQSAAAKVITVNPGGSIQAAVDVALPGDKIVVNPGTYTEAGRPCPYAAAQTCAVIVSVDRVRLWANNHAGPVVLQAASGQATGIFFGKPGADPTTCAGIPSARISGAQVWGFDVRGFSTSISAAFLDAGISLLCPDKWRVTRNRVADGLAIGILVQTGGAGRISHNVATGLSNRSGIRIADTDRTRIDRNEASEDSVGIQVDGGVGDRIDHNSIHDNTMGLFTLTDVADPAQSLLIDENNVADNNKADTTVFSVIQGAGIFASDGDGTLVTRNVATGNDSFGIYLAGSPTNARVLFNTALGNGTAPDVGVPPNNTDIAWSGSGSNDCQAGNVFATEFVPLPICP